MDKWKPIDTAPKNGNTVLVFDSYIPKEGGGQNGNDGYGVTTARYDGSKWVMHSRYGIYICCTNPTFWMDLPSSPNV